MMRKKVRGSTVERVSIPEEFYKDNKFVKIAADVMFVSGVAFFVTYLKKIRFLTVEYLPQRTAKQLANALRKVVFLYARGGFVVHYGIMDTEFEKVKDSCPLGGDQFHGGAGTCGICREKDTAFERKDQGRYL